MAQDTQNSKIVIPKEGSYENLQEFIFNLLWENTKGFYAAGTSLHTTGLPSAYYTELAEVICKHKEINTLT